MKRIIVVSAIAASCVCLTLVIALATPPDGPGITKANFDRIEDGMTRKQVEAIFGQSSSPSFGLMGGGVVISHDLWRHENGATVHVTFVDDAVSEKSWQGSSETFPGRVRRWLAKLTFNRKNP